MLSQKGFSLVELVIAMTILGIALLSYELISYSTKESLNSLDNDSQVVDLASDKFNEFIITGQLDSGSTTDVNVVPSGSGLVLTSNNDNKISINLEV